jgi:hypothetical protein
LSPQLNLDSTEEVNVLFVLLVQRTHAGIFKRVAGIVMGAVLGLCYFTTWHAYKQTNGVNTFIVLVWIRIPSTFAFALITCKFFRFWTVQARD